MVDPLIHALVKTEIEFGKMIWFIGDSETDMEFANMTLSTGILYNPKKTSESNYFSCETEDNMTKKTMQKSELKEDLEVKSMEEVLLILKSMFPEKK